MKWLGLVRTSSGVSRAAAAAAVATAASSSAAEVLTWLRKAWNRCLTGCETEACVAGPKRMVDVMKAVASRCLQ